MGETQGSRRASSVTRRCFLTVTSTAVCAAGLESRAFAQTSRKAAKYLRLNVADPKAAGSLSSYERAVEAMLSLAPTDPRNWYRMAIIHLLDCSHGNWWFLPWHRGYLGWFEQICRDLSKDGAFALPYWDWTANPELPAAFLKGKLNPANFAIDGVADFRKKFEAPVMAFWQSLNAPQLAQLQLRGLSSIDVFWKLIEGKVNPNDTAAQFPKLADVRLLNPPRSPALSARTKKAVSLGTIRDALAPREFVGFGSGKQSNHHLAADYGTLEGQPHDLVHHNVGGYFQGNPSTQGFMRAALSPVDPIFWLHHSNIDRLWDVWTRKQQAYGLKNPAARMQYPTAPQGADLRTWSSEPFLFFVDAGGKPTTKTNAGDYIAMEVFDYEYQSGSGEIVVPVEPGPAHSLANRSFAATLSDIPGLLRGVQAVVDVPGGLFEAIAANEAVRVVARITVQIMEHFRTMRMHLLLDPSAETRTVNFNDPSYAGTFEPIGGHFHGGGDHGMEAITFTIGLTDTIKRLRDMERLQPEKPLNLHVVPLAGANAPAPVKVTRVSLNSL